jgi:hypothetical protein
LVQGKDRETPGRKIGAATICSLKPEKIENLFYIPETCKATNNP